MPGTRRVRPSPGAAITSSPWIVVSIGVIVMVVLLVVAVTSARGRRAYPDATPSYPAMSLPALPVPATSQPPASASAPVAPGSSPRSAALPSRSAVLPSRTTQSPSARPTVGGGDRPAAPAAPPSPVTGRYRVVSSFHAGFIGEVRMYNGGDTARGWTVRLSFARGRYVTSWVEGAEQGTASFAGGVFTYRSGVDVAPEASVSLRFYFEDTGTTRPVSCTVDDAPCSGS